MQRRKKNENQRISLRADWRRLYSNGKWALQRTWKASSKLTGGLILTSGFAAILPAILTLVIGMLVNEIRLAIDHQSLDQRSALQWLILASVIVLVSNILQILRQFFRQRLGDILRLEINRETLEHANRLDLPFFENLRSQDILSRATQHQGSDFLSFVSDSITSLSTSIQLISLFSILFWIDPILTPFLFVLGTPWFFFNWHLSKTRYEIYRSKTTKRRWTRYYFSRLLNRKAVPAVKLLRIGRILIERFEAGMKELMQVDQKLYRRQAVGGFLASLVFTLGFIFVISIVGFRTIEGNLPFNHLIAYLLAAFRFRGSLTDLIQKITATMEKVLVISNLREYLATQPAIRDTGTFRPKTVSGKIEVEALSFHYPGNRRVVLKDISLHIDPGETVAIVGPNGSGKTTLVKLLCRLYEANQGRIKIDEHDIREYPLDFFYKQIACVHQKDVQFESTVREAIAFGDWERLQNSPEEVEKISQQTQLNSMIQRMPRGMDTMLGRMFGTHDLSGGEWQKISVARAIAKNARIYILDEPTAHLDARSEYQIFSAFRNIVKKQTTILISHRFSTANIADRILVMDNGQIVEQGTHEQLIKKRGVYRELFRLHETLFRKKSMGYLQGG